MSISKQLLDGINTLRAGNSQGFDIVYGETSSYVFARARMIMNDEQDANDLVQDTYIQAYQNINSLQDPHNIFAWLGGIAYRQGMKIYRKKNDILLGDDNDGFFEQIENEDIEWNPELSMEQKAVGNIVAEIIDELPPLQKAALTAFYYDGLKIDQIAQMFDCSSNTIKSRLTYAKKFVREKVEIKEKQDDIRLHSVGGVSIFLLGLHQLLASPKYNISPALSGQIYLSVCRSLRFKEVITPNSSVPNISSLKNSFLNCSSVNKTAILVGSTMIGTLVTIAIIVAMYNYLTTTNPESTETTTSVIYEVETQDSSETTEVSETATETETTETSETATENTTTETSEATEEINTTEPSETTESSKVTESPGNSNSSESFFDDSPDISITVE